MSSDGTVSEQRLPIDPEIIQSIDEWRSMDKDTRESHIVSLPAAKYATWCGEYSC